MTWFVEDQRSWTQKLFGNMLKNGPLPRHVALIMDGNRRYAKNKNIEKIKGHISGFDKLVESLNWCFTMNIKEVTVYAFSIENFKRSADEVNGLLDLAREKFQKLIEEKDKCDKLGVCIRIFGNLALLPEDLQKTIAKVMTLTKDNNKLFMNVCIAYTSRDEMSMAVKDICQGVEENRLEIKDITDDLIENCLYTSHSCEVDLLVRTSGEVRLSDFLLWQSNITPLTFVDQLWPEFTIWNFYFGILDYQLNFKSINETKKRVEQFRKSELEKEFNKNVDMLIRHDDRVADFLADLHSQRVRKLELLAQSA